MCGSSSSSRGSYSFWLRSDCGGDRSRWNQLLPIQIDADVQSLESVSTEQHHISLSREHDGGSG
jgi:hypothetical protein